MVLSAVALVLALPLLALSAAAIRLTSEGPALFRQERVGRFGQRFFLLKLRTMRAGSGPQVTAAGDPRVTAVGKLLRRTKVDELPQLWNVLRGDMSLVGPRPEMPLYVDISDARWRSVLEIRPGITDLVSLHLRNEEELLALVRGDREAFYRGVMVPFKLNKYLEYQSYRSSFSDLRVLALTLLSAASRRFVRPYEFADLQSRPPGPIQS